MDGSISLYSLINPKIASESMDWFERVSEKKGEVNLTPICMCYNFPRFAEEMCFWCPLDC